MQTEIKILKQQQESLGAGIMNYMNTQNLEVCNAGELGVLTIHITNAKSSLNKECIRNGLLACLKESRADTNPEDFADRSADYIVNNRETEERKRLKRKSVN